MEVQPISYFLVEEFPNQSSHTPSLLSLNFADLSYDRLYSLVLQVTKFYLLNYTLLAHKLSSV